MIFRADLRDMARSKKSSLRQSKTEEPRHAIFWLKLDESSLNLRLCVPVNSSNINTVKTTLHLCDISDGCNSKVRGMINEWDSNITSDIKSVGSDASQLPSVRSVNSLCHHPLRWHCCQVLIGWRIIRKHCCVRPRTWTKPNHKDTP